MSSPSDELAKLRSVMGTGRKTASTHRLAKWSLDTLVGRLVEISGSATTASLTMAVGLVLEAQERREPVAWVATEDSTFYPPDLASSGIDLTALPVIRIDHTNGSKGSDGNRSVKAARVADTLVRSGAFLLVILDLGARCELPLAAQTRLSGLAAKHETALIGLTRKSRDAPSIGSLVSIRGEGRKERTDFDSFTWELHILKDKQRGPTWDHREECRGPDGLC